MVVYDALLVPIYRHRVTYFASGRREAQAICLVGREGRRTRQLCMQLWHGAS